MSLRARIEQLEQQRADRSACEQRISTVKVHRAAWLRDPAAPSASPEFYRASWVKGPAPIIPETTKGTKYCGYEGLRAYLSHKSPGTRAS